jgi:hypothetical protein
MEKLKIEDLKKDLFLGDFGEEFEQYDNGYICDIITEIADRNVSIYNYVLLNWAKDNYGYIEEAMDEFGQPTDNKGHFDFIKCIQQGQFYANEQDIYENLKDIILNRLYNYIVSNLGITEITEKQNFEIECLNIEDNNEQLENLFEELEKIFIEEVEK